MPHLFLCVCVCVAEMLSLSYASRVGELREMRLLARVLAVQTVICKNKTAEVSRRIQVKNPDRDHGKWWIRHWHGVSPSSQGIPTLVWRSECDGLCCELVIKVPGVCLWCHLRFEQWGKLAQGRRLVKCHSIGTYWISKITTCRQRFVTRAALFTYCLFTLCISEVLNISTGGQIRAASFLTDSEITFWEPLININLTKNG